MISQGALARPEHDNAVHPSAMPKSPICQKAEPTPFPQVFRLRSEAYQFEFL